MYTMKETCEILNISYQTLKYYCNEGLVPNIKRDKNNHRLFDDNDINWLNGLLCLRKCGMSIKDMKLYMNYCLIGKDSIPQRKEMLEKTKEKILNQIKELNSSLQYIDNKQQYYNNVLTNKIEYSSYILKKDDHI